MHRETDRAVLRDHAEVAGDDASGLNGFERGRRRKDHGHADGLNDGGIDERHGQMLEVVGQMQQIAANVDVGAGKHSGPQRGVGRVFALHGVVADEFEGERVVVDQKFGRNGEIGLGIAAVGTAIRPRRGLDGGEESSVHHQLDVAQLGKEAGRERVMNVNLRGTDYMGLRQSEIDAMPGVDRVQLDLVDLGLAGFGEREVIVILAGRNGSIDVGDGRLRRVSNRLRNDDFALQLGVSRLTAPCQRRGQKEQDESAGDGERTGLALRRVVVAEDAAGGEPHAAHGDLEDAAQTAQHIVALAGLAPAEP